MVTRDAPRLPSSKVMDLEAARTWRTGVRGAVVFTNGVFDLLHLGHVSILDTSRREGAALIVGLNSDASSKTGIGDSVCGCVVISQAIVVDGNVWGAAPRGEIHRAIGSTKTDGVGGCEGGRHGGAHHDG